MSSQWTRRTTTLRGKHPTEDIIYGRLVDAIIEKHLRPGEHLNENKLAEAHGVPRSRVRRVLERLRDENVVTFELHRGAFISRPTVEEAHHVYEARRETELTVVRLACARATPDDVTRLETHLQREDAAFRNEDPNFNKVSGDFHYLLAEMARNPVFEKLLGSLIRQWVLIQSVYERKGGAALCLTHEHRSIVAAIAANRPEEAVAELAHHFDHILAALDLSDDRRSEIDIYDVSELTSG
ncbi:GntR family transcriptional regulator [Acuticoccus sp. I52.16.1]|uniref:GntR family transcriptional regulator n=1 Tax=Acuticoccus sp. I52.16.1 TaxID=2928472 RepID=UPI001FD416B2|nr:GntR family transcriptional regulator [Acuticoccus sp. I52.16.1]UOM34876.1 GntR family transcriptional regulator [Acuticoccus sp. I52.16.1]